MDQSTRTICDHRGMLSKTQSVVCREQITSKTNIPDLKYFEMIPSQHLLAKQASKYLLLLHSNKGIACCYQRLQVIYQVLPMYIFSIDSRCLVVLLVRGIPHGTTQGQSQCRNSVKRWDSNAVWNASESRDISKDLSTSNVIQSIPKTSGFIANEVVFD